MGRITLTNIDRAYGKLKILHDINLDIRDGELLVLVGPSGCGKSTLLRLIAGLDQPTAGKLEIDGRDVTKVTAADRGLAMVFQSYALYPHMTVRQNLAFGLENIRMAKTEIDNRISEAARMLEIGPISTGVPASFRAASASASRSAAPWCEIPPRSCWTSRCPTSTPNCESPPAPRSRRCTSVWRRR
jgi:ABC-type sugar transport system ATPase subunit